MIEFGAILGFRRKTGKFIPHEPVARYDTLQWLIVQVANVGPMSGPNMCIFSKFAGAGNDYSARRYRTQVLKLFIFTSSGWGLIPMWPAADDRPYRDVALVRNLFELLAVDPANYPTVKSGRTKSLHAMRSNTRLPR